MSRSVAVWRRLFQQHADSLCGEFTAWLVDRRQRRADRGGQRRVVEPNHGKLSRNVDLLAISNGKDASRHVVIAGEDRRGSTVLPEHFLSGEHTGIEGEVAILDQVGHLDDSRLSERLAISGKTPTRLGVCVCALDEADAAMAELDEVVRHLTRGGGVIYGDVLPMLDIFSGRDADEGNAPVL